jgi:hypothetical protein
MIDDLADKYMLEEYSPENENSFYLYSYDNYDYESTYRKSKSETN